MLNISTFFGHRPAFLVFALFFAISAGSANAATKVAPSDIERLLRGNEQEKYDAIQAAIDFDKMEFIEQIRPLTSDPDFFLRGQAGLALIHLGKGKRYQEVADLLNDSEPHIPSLIAEGIWLNQARQYLDDIAKMFDDENPSQRFTAMNTFYRFSIFNYPELEKYRLKIENMAENDPAENVRAKAQEVYTKKNYVR